MLQGAPEDAVRRARSSGDPFPGTAGFAGVVDATSCEELAGNPDTERRLVRDVLGRYPLFIDADSDEWALSPSDLERPRSFPAGHARPVGDDGDATGESERVWTLPAPDPYDDERAAVADLRTAIRHAAGATVGGRDAGDADTGGRDEATDVDDNEANVAVAFSGGVDSAVVAAELERAGVGAPLYVGGFAESHDVDAARSAARAMDRSLRIAEFTVDAVERAVPEVARAIGRPDAMAVQIALPLYLVAERAAADGYDRLAVGQGADELFGGYAKVARAPDDPRVEADTVRGARREMLATLPDQLERDVLTLRAAGVEPVAPLLHDRVVATALRLPGDALVDARGERKRAFRLAARTSVPDSVAFREKKAVQYGSLVSRELDRLAREAGFKRRTDDHVTEYVRSRIDE
jgi:asparagine synthase (glutamine-hydrolysing)